MKASLINTGIGTQKLAEAPLLNLSGVTGRQSLTGALVLSGGAPALGVIRSLGRHHIPVWIVVSKVDHRIAGLSRYCGRTIHWPDSGETEQIEFLLELGRRHGLDGWILLATDDERAALLARYRELLECRFHVPPPAWEVMQWVYDKRLTYQLASDLGVNHPKTYYPQNREEVGALHCDFPVILKPAFKQFLNSFTRARAWLARDPDELLRRYDEAVALTDPKIVMIQEFIAGGNENQFSYAALHWAGRSIASLVARRTRQYPLDFSQGSSYVETIECGEIEVSSKRLLGAIKYDGIVEVEFKRDNRDKTYKLLDVNARVWGWHTLGFRSGLDFSYLLFQCMQGQPVQEIHAAKGLKWIRFVRDVPAAYGQYRKGALSFRTYLRSLIDASEFAVLAKDDPLPALLEIPFLLASRFYRFRRLQTVQRFYY